MYFYILLFNPEGEDENVHSVLYGGENILLLFQDKDDADRYSILLEAQDFPLPSVVAVDSSEVENVCNVEGYIAQIVPTNFFPVNRLQRLMIFPPDLTILSDQEFTSFNVYQDEPFPEILPLRFYSLLDPEYEDEDDSDNLQSDSYTLPLGPTGLPIDPSLTLFESLEIEIFRHLFEDLM
ncbi:MAG TPA: DUF3110 domain-containing protein [Prochlorococcaceae cyanobacterium AMR_MDS_5431]|nr:DUF3110 domain-containing protein [Prochlorococcaceae cyanobacterium AMR_MDS_5431]